MRWKLRPEWSLTAAEVGDSCVCECVCECVCVSGRSLGPQGPASSTPVKRFSTDSLLCPAPPPGQRAFWSIWGWAGGAAQPSRPSRQGSQALSAPHTPPPAVARVCGSMEASTKFCQMNTQLYSWAQGSPSEPRPRGGEGGDIKEGPGAVPRLPILGWGTCREQRQRVRAAGQGHLAGRGAEGSLVPAFPGIGLSSVLAR